MVRSISWSGGRAGSAWPSSSKQEAGSSFFFKCKQAAESANRKKGGSVNTQSHFQLNTSSSKVLPLKDYITFLSSATNWGPTV